jgi:hypothetical protein
VVPTSKVADILKKLKDLENKHKPRNGGKGANDNDANDKDTNRKDANEDPKKKLKLMMLDTADDIEG